MRLLLDTHAFLWWTTDSKALKQDAKSAIIDPANQIFLSTISIWELGLKKALRRLILPEEIEEELALRRIEVLPITAAHAVRAPRLPLIHSDPFDRMLIAQAQIEKLTIVTRDREFADYDVAILKT